MTEEKKGEKSGSHSDNDLSKTQKIMKDNDLPFYHSKEQEDDDEQEES